MKRYRVGILGATGMVGQRLVTLLAGHPWFGLSALAASPHSAGKTYAQAVAGRWRMAQPLPGELESLEVLDAGDVQAMARAVDFVFCAVSAPKEETRALEEAYARAEVPVISSNSACRMLNDVPMIIPEINPDHARAIPAQRRRLGLAAVHRGEAQLLHPVLYAAPDPADGLPPAGGPALHLPGGERSRSRNGQLAGDAGQPDPLHPGRRGEERDGAAEGLGQPARGADPAGPGAPHQRPVRPGAGLRRPPCHCQRPLPGQAGQGGDPPALAGARPCPSSQSASAPLPS